MRKSEEITWERFNQLRVNADILEQDEYGIKVLRLESGDIFKVFRVKSIISGARIYSYARRFCRNAERLQKLDVPTVRIRQLYHFENSTNTAVLYQPLEGLTLWQMAGDSQLGEEVLARLGEFVARLHQLGIYFRSLHLGNIVLTPANELGLIDISDMSITPWALGRCRRIRNFRQMLRRLQGIKALDLHSREAFLASYITHSQGSISPSLGKRLKQLIAAN
jgi:tRNA A-37 threonylcarbamoyl transferase component Bud32